MTAIRPRLGSLGPQDELGNQGGSAQDCLEVRRFHASTSPVTISTFSCDIAYSGSPAASRASERSEKSCCQTTRPRRSLKSWKVGMFTGTPLPVPCPLY